MDWSALDAGTTEELSMTREDLMEVIAIAQQQMNEHLEKFGLEVPDFDFDVEGFVRYAATCTMHSAARENTFNVGTPTWTGLAVSKKRAMVANSRESKINRHGGASSNRTGKKPKKTEPVGLARDSQGKHKPSK